MLRALLLAAVTLSLCACNDGPSTQPDAGTDAGVTDGGVAGGARLFLDGTGADLVDAAQPQLAVDADGGLRVLVTSKAADGTGAFPVRYGECAGPCGQPAAWKFVTLGDHQAAGGLARFVVLPSGGVRAVYFRQATTTGSSTLVFAECDGACTSAANWTLGDLTTFAHADATQVGPTPLAVDPQGKLQLVIGGAADFTWGTCATACSTASHWTFAAQAGVQAHSPTLALTAAGQPRVLVEAAEPTGEGIVELLSCDGACDQRASWGTPAVLFWGRPGGRQVLRVDAADHLRAAFFQGQPGRPDAAATDDRVLYAWCDGSCDQPTAWNAATAGLDPGWGRAGLDLWLDADGGPTLAFDTTPSPYALAVAHCTQACTTSTAKWKPRTIETGDDVSAAVTATLPALCSGGQRAWAPGAEVAFAANPKAGGFEAVHVARLLETCGTTVTPKLGVPRYARVEP